MRVRPTVQITLALVLLTSATLFIVHLLLGVFPDPELQTMRLRKALAESMATHAAVLLERGDRKSLAVTLQRAREQNSSIRSLAVRRANNTLLAQAGKHEAAWREFSGDHSTLTHLLVPLSVGSERWGSFEMTYFPDERGALAHALSHPLWVTLLAVALLGTLIYWTYLRRALVHLDPKAVIPERVRLALDVMTEGVVMLDRRSRVLLANRAFCALLGEESAALVGKRLSRLPWLAPGLPRDAATHPWAHAMREATPVIDYAVEVACAQATRKLIVNCAPIADARGVVRGCMATFDDLTPLHLANERLSQTLAELHASKDEIQQKNVELEHMATHDALTGCLTRRAFFERMARAREDALRNGTALTCLALDIDQFKSVNDRFGHAVGDRVVEEVGRNLIASLRATDIIGRYGGDEFFAGMPGCDCDQARLLAEKIRCAIEQHCSTSFENVVGLQVTVSIGLASLADGDGTLANLIEQADQALYDAKSRGRNRVAGLAASASAVVAEAEVSRPLRREA